MKRKKIAFIKHGHFSHINDNLIIHFSKAFSAYDLDIIDTRCLLSNNSTLLKFIYAAFREYGPDIIRRYKKVRSCMLQTTYAFHAFRQFIHNNLNDDYTFTFQTQSLFDASTFSKPHFVYSDHTHLANLFYPMYDTRRLYSSKWIALERSIYHNAILNFTMSNNISDSIINQYGVARERAECVYCGSNLGESVEASLNHDRFDNKNILFVGVDWVRKGGPQLAKAFARVLKAHPDATLTVVGCSPRLRLPNCRVIGKVPLKEVYAYYKKCSIFCLPTLEEPFGIAFIEAASFGLPIVATNIGAIPDFVIDGTNGYMVEPNDIEQLSDKLIKLLDDPYARMRFGNNNYSTIREKYTWKKTVNRMKNSIDKWID
jgi:glycosyltransferase involved in cell wall biosynthesis